MPSPTVDAGTRTSGAETLRADDDCLHWLWRELYAADGIHAPCSNCGKVRKHHRVRARRAFACDACGHQVYPTSGTFLERSGIGLSTWFRGVELVVASDGRAPAKRLAHDLGLGYRTALRMRSRILGAWREDETQSKLVTRICDGMEARSDQTARRAAQAPGQRTTTPTKERIRAAACKAFARRGLAATRVADIAAEAGVSTATVHHYFGSKERILLAALEWSAEQTDNKTIRIRHETTDHLEALRRILLWNVPREGEVRDHYRLWLEIWVAIERHPELMRSCAAMSISWQDFFRDLVAEGAAAGAFHPVAPADEVAKRITTMLTGLSLKITVGYEAWRPDQAAHVLFWFVAEQLGLPPSVLGAHAP